ncbi:aminotransferase-like domain-containing protein [Vagococcus vulneris]|uniref:HTH gntR-type domain-containing protein n=1 Tax=Vagococcus vulneris TaxID=1977869 RepID=A0A429ZZG1_9ENTE|nr:PLP-dependent aminotransferase family protein [Vagococcus vulneris]RST99366.1 hypothetical protein CBF37_05185 [Vagococcus vulneris]
MRIELSRESKVPLYQQIMQQIIEKIGNGELEMKRRLPSERQLAKELMVNRSTIVRAYDELCFQGFVERKVNSGTFVSKISTESVIVRQLSRIGSASTNQSKDENEYLDCMKQKSLIKNQSFIDTYTGELPTALIPEIKLPDLIWNDFLKRENQSLGLLDLRRIIAKNTAVNYQVLPDPDDLMVTSGGSQSLFFLIQTLLKPGDTVVIEDPSFFKGLSVLKLMSLNVIRVPVDSEGMRVSQLKEILTTNNVRLVITNPNFQNPTGTTLSLERRIDLIKSCRLFNTIIIEDDVFGQLAYQVPNRLPLLKELAPDLVIYIGSLSKVLGKNIQLGWIYASRIILDEVVRLRDETENNLSIFPQVLAEVALKMPSFNKQLKDLRCDLSYRMTDFRIALMEHLSDSVTATFPQGGHYIWLTVTSRKLKKDDWLHLLNEGIAVYPSYLNDRRDFQSCRVNVSRLKNDDVSAFIAGLKKMIRG